MSVPLSVSAASSSVRRDGATLRRNARLVAELSDCVAAAAREALVPQLARGHRVATCYSLRVSKAFKGEDASEAPIVVPPRAPLPEGQTNYVTPRGLAALQRERDDLQRERAQREAHPDAVDSAHAIAVLTARLAAVQERLANARLVEQSTLALDRVRFGARVRARADAGTERIWTLVGVDEADAASGLIAFTAPLARALLGKRVGDVARVRAPRGTEEWEILAIEYEPFR
jgi:transcription elongation factor GreB